MDLHRVSFQGSGMQLKRLVTADVCAYLAQQLGYVIPRIQVEAKVSVLGPDSNQLSRDQIGLCIRTNPPPP